MSKHLTVSPNEAADRRAIRELVEAYAHCDQADPENSLILRKPTSSSETEGVAGSATLAHGGGIRFTKDSPEYATILQWIKGAKE